MLLESGLTVPVPAGWNLATRVTRLKQPDELFTLSSSAPVSDDQDSCGPTTAVRNLGAEQALAFVFEYEKPSVRLRRQTARRPRQFRLPARAPPSLE